MAAGTGPSVVCVPPGPADVPTFVLLWTDAAMWLLAGALLLYVRMVLRRPGLKATWKKVFGGAAALAASVVLALCLGLTLS